jgi:6-phosphogluconolactonase
MTATTFRTAAIIPLILALASCGGNGTTPPTAACVPTQPSEFAYVLNGDSIAMYTVDSCTGALMATTPATVATGSTSGEPSPEGLIADPMGRFAYVANIISNATDNATISMYTVDPSTGVLAPNQPATVPTGFYPQGIAINSTGQFVYTANSDGNSVSMFTVDANTGNLTPTTPATVAAGWSPVGVTVHPSGKFAYAVNQNDGTVSMYTVNQTSGVLTPTTPATVPAGGSPFGITIDPSGRFAYVPDAYSTPNDFVSQYTIDSTTGVLTPNATAAVSAGNQSTSVAVDPSGKFAYVTNRGDNTVSMFTIDSTGSLTPNGIAGTNGEPFQVVVDPSGKFVYVANEDGPLSIYTLQSDGTLMTAGSVVTGTSPALAVAVIKAR